MKCAIVQLKYVPGKTYIVPISWIKKFNSKFKPTESFLCYISVNIADVPNFDVEYFKTDFNGTTGTFKVFIIKITNSFEDAIIYQREKRMKSVPKKFREPTNTEAEIKAEQNRKRLSAMKIQKCDKRKAMVRNVAYLSDTLFKFEHEEEPVIDELPKKKLKPTNSNVTSTVTSSMVMSRPCAMDIYFPMNIPKTASNDHSAISAEHNARTVSKDDKTTDFEHTSKQTDSAVSRGIRMPTISSIDLNEQTSEHGARSIINNVQMHTAVADTKETLKMSVTDHTVMKSAFTKIDETMQCITEELNNTSNGDPKTTIMAKDTGNTCIQTSTPTFSALNMCAVDINIEQQPEPLKSVTQCPKAINKTSGITEPGTPITDSQQSIIVGQSVKLDVEVELSDTGTSSSPCAARKSLKVPTSRKTRKRQPNDIDRDTYMVSDTKTYIGEPSMDRNCMSEKQAQAPVLTPFHESSVLENERLINKCTHTEALPSQPTIQTFPINEIISVTNTSIDSLEPVHTLDFDELISALDKDMYIIPAGQNFTQITGSIDNKIEMFPCSGQISPKITNTSEKESLNHPSTSVFVEQSNSTSIPAISRISIDATATGDTTGNCSLCEKLQLENITLQKENIDLTERNIALQHAIVSITSTVPQVPPVPFEEKDGGRLYENSIFLNRTQCDILDRINDPQKYLNNVVLAIFGSETLKNSSVTGSVSNSHKTPPKPRLDPLRLKLIYSLMASMTNNSPTFSSSKINQILNRKISNLNATGKPRKTNKKTNSAQIV